MSGDRQMPDGVRLTLLAVATTAAVAGIFAVIRLAYPTTPGLGPTAAPAPAPRTPAPIVAEKPPPPVPGPWVVADEIPLRCCDTAGRSLDPPVPAVRCLPASEYRTRPEHPHFWVVPLKGSWPEPGEITDPLYRPGERCPGFFE